MNQKIGNNLLTSIGVSCIIFIFLLVISSGLRVLNKNIHSSFYGVKNAILQQSVNSNILLVELDEKSLREIGSFPFSRKKYATLIENLSEYKPSVIAFDFMFLDPSDPDSDLRLKESIRDFSNVVFGAGVNSSGSLLLPEARLGISGNQVGFLAPSIDTSNNVAYSFIPEYSDTNKKLTHFAIKILQHFYYHFLEDKTIFNGERTERVYSIGNISIPYARPGGEEILINYVPDELFPKISFSELLSSNNVRRIDSKYNLQDKIVLIGPAADGLGDEFFTPIGKQYGMYIHAQILNTVLSKNYMLFFDPRAEWGLILMIILLSVLVNLSRSMRVILIGNFAIIGFFWIFLPLVILFGMRLMLNFPAEIILSLILTVLSTNAIKFGVEERNKKKLSSALGQYVSEDIARHILSGDGNINLDGQNKNLVCFFSDIENFTNMSEKLNPEKLVALLREYLGEMTKIIMERDGHIDKFEGDSIMALWGAFTLHEKNDYLKACDAALIQTKVIQEYSNAWREKFSVDIRARMGIHGGEAIIGNIGAQGQKMDFTALGDNVNLASRLEGINKYYHTYICVSERVYAASKHMFVFRYLDRIQVKGKDVPINIYELRGRMTDSNDAEQEFIEAFEFALDLYQKGHFSEAQVRFQKLEGNDPTSKVFIERCENFMQNSPSNWDGTWRFNEK